MIFGVNKRDCLEEAFIIGLGEFFGLDPKNDASLAAMCHAYTFKMQEKTPHVAVRWYFAPCSGTSVYKNYMKDFI